MDSGCGSRQSRRMTLRIQCLCIDTADPAGLAAFWQSALGWRRTFERDDEVVLEPPEGSPEDGIVPDLLFLRVPGGKEVGQESPPPRPASRGPGRRSSAAPGARCAPR